MYHYHDNLINDSVSLQGTYVILSKMTNIPYNYELSSVAVFNSAVNLLIKCWGGGGVLVIGRFRASITLN